MGRNIPLQKMPWKLVWVKLKNNWVDKKAASLQYKLIHLIKRTKFAIRPHRCPRRACQVADADYIHTCFRCPSAKNYWKTVIITANIIGAEESKTTLLNLVTGIPDIANKNTEVKTKQASITWT